jgi:hypothetical protein
MGGILHKFFRQCANTYWESIGVGSKVQLYKWEDKPDAVSFVVCTASMCEDLFVSSRYLTCQWNVRTTDILWRCA